MVRLQNVTFLHSLYLIVYEQVEDYTLQINEMKELFRKRSSDFNMIQAGFKEIKEFQKRKAEMEQELTDVREGGATQNIKCFLLKSGGSFSGFNNYELFIL